MGTRNLTMVIDKDGDLKVAQYGQWDGYPSGQGAIVLAFCKQKDKLQKLQEELNHTAFIYDNEYLKEWYEEDYCKKCPNWSSDPDLRTQEMKFWWEHLMTRDLGAEILENILSARDINSEMFGDRKLPKEHNGKIVLYNDSNFGKNSLMCEWAYCVNLQTNKLECFAGFNQNKEKEHPRFATIQEEVEKDFAYTDRRYYGIRLIKEYDLDNLPTEEEFVEELRSLVKGEEDE